MVSALDEAASKRDFLCLKTLSGNARQQRLHFVLPQQLLLRPSPHELSRRRLHTSAAHLDNGHIWSTFMSTHLNAWMPAIFGVSDVKIHGELPSFHIWEK